VKNKLGRFGSFGSILAAAACPICFPKLALLGALFGFGALAEYEVIFFYALQVLIVAMVVSHVIAFNRGGDKRLLILVSVSAVLFFVSLYVLVSEYLSYLALAGLVASSVWLMLVPRDASDCHKC
jgi:mercuric ion transport protein